MKPSINAKILLLGAVLVSCSWRGPASSDSGRAPSSAEGALNSGELEAPAAKVLGQYLALLNEGSFLTREQAHEKLEKIPANEKDLSGKDVAYIFNASQMRAVSGSESLKSVLIEYRVVGSVDSEAGFQQIPEVAVFALFNLQDRGALYIGPSIEVYEGMVIGNVSRGKDMTVNPTRGKHLTNMRASGSDEALTLTPPLKLTLERGLEIMADDELLEITPQSIRLRKKILDWKR